jgi:hypothetical protein
MYYRLENAAYSWDKVYESSKAIDNQFFYGRELKGAVLYIRSHSKGQVEHRTLRSVTEIIGGSLRAGTYTLCSKVILLKAPLEASLVVKDQRAYDEEEAVISQPPVSIDHNVGLLW